MEACLVNEQTRWSKNTRPLVLTIALLAASAAFARPAVVLFPSLGHPDAVTVTGRVYKDAGTHGSSTFSRNLRRLTASNWVGAPVELRFAGVTTESRAGKDGVFTATLKPKPGTRFPTGIGFVDVRAGENAASGRGAVNVVSNDAPFVVVSDFDDTLAISNVLSTRKLVANALFNDSTTQPVVPGMSHFYSCLGTGKKASPGFALVSGSPEQFVPRIAVFLAHNDFPFFGMYLRNFGPDTMSGYKQPKIRRMLEELPQKFILVGDSGEHDAEVYAEMRREFPDRIAAIYIRNAGNTADLSRFEGMTLFDDAKDAAADALRKGLISGDCFQRAFPQATAADVP